ncbi:uncharacterized protein LOC135848911 isoform X3 [Planococcus citri]|uniref:uncharacterized protein LOC135848911 isoform X3 n=1 Tax=Planococcus citri TaxID=170843 RepID=UPI0031F73D50
MKYCSFLLFCHIFVNFDRFNVVNIFCKCQSDLQYKDDDESERVFDEIRIVKKADPTYETSPYTMSVLNQSYHDQEEEEDRMVHGVLIFGFDPQINDEADIRECSLRIFKDIMRLKVKYEDITFVEKMGNDIDYKRPVLVKLSKRDLKDQILFHRKRLRGLRYKIENYLSRESLLKQKDLIPVMKFYRKMGKYAIIREGMLIVNGKIIENVNYLIERLRLLRSGNYTVTGANNISVISNTQATSFYIFNYTDQG